MKLIFKAEIIIGAWILIAPWILGFYGFAPALWSSIVNGAAVLLVGLWGLFGDER